MGKKIELEDHEVEYLRTILATRQELGDDIAGKILRKMIELRPFEDYDDVLSMKDFVQCVEEGALTDDDGHGYYATAEGPTDVLVDLNDIDQGYLSVVWINR